MWGSTVASQLPEQNAVNLAERYSSRQESQKYSQRNVHSFVSTGRAHLAAA
jgi:hypothetical protein